MRDAEVLPDGPVFLCPGQGGFDLKMMRTLSGVASLRPLRQAAVELGCRYLGQPFDRLLDGDEAEARELLRGYRDLDQLGILLLDVSVGRLLEQEGVVPALVVGHSMGEIAGFVLSGALTFEQSVDIMCKRILSLRDGSPPDCGMLGLSCGADAAATLLSAIPESGVCISVMNFERQTVVSGPRQGLTAVKDLAGPRGIGASFLASNHPFHSPALAQAARAFRTRLGCVPAAAPGRALFLPSEGRLFAGSPDIGDFLARQLITPYDFFASARRLVKDASGKVFVEAGVGTIVSGLLAKVAPAAVTRFAPLPADARDPLASLRAVAALLRTAGSSPPSPVEPQAARAAAQGTARRTGGDSAAPSRGLPSGGAPAVWGAPRMPLAVVGMGAVLPAAASVADFQMNLRAGIGGLIQVGDEFPTDAMDFCTAGPVKADRTYSLLSGFIAQTPYREGLLASSYSRAEFEALPRAERLLVLATAEALFSWGAGKTAGRTAELVLGSTADGIEELDERLIYDRVQATVSEALAAEPQLREQVLRSLQARWREKSGRPVSDRDRRATEQAAIAVRVVSRLAGPRASAYIVDTACSSSIYAVALAARALRARRCDYAIAGGMFAAGPVNSVLFAQFQGLSASGSRPFDRSADGVVFGDGSAMLVLRRLDDAVADGDRILGVIRDVGTSSDGKSPSINVPRAGGQELALRRALLRSGVSPQMVQAVEAHATATPVGDATELASIKAVFQSSSADSSAPVWLTSVKSLIGHTGWTAGSASIIKVLLSMRTGEIPQQWGFTATSEKVVLPENSLRVPRATVKWPAPASGQPRRAGVNSFGFGGTNAHVIVEDYLPSYHQDVLGAVGPAEPADQKMAVLGLIAIRSRRAGAKPEGDADGGRQKVGEMVVVDRVQLPNAVRVLPDVAEDMDSAHQLAIAMGARLMETLAPSIRETMADEIGVCLGISGKLPRSVSVGSRIFREKLKRLLDARDAEQGTAAAGGEVGAAPAIVAALERSKVSGPYTLPGAMPNVTASRVPHAFNLRGPNLVVDDATCVLSRALAAAEDMFLEQHAKLFLVGAVEPVPDSTGLDGACSGVLMLVTSEALAKEMGLASQASIRMGETARELAARPGDLWAKAKELRERLSDRTEAGAVRGEREDSPADPATAAAPAAQAVTSLAPDLEEAASPLEGAPIYALSQTTGLAELPVRQGTASGQRPSGKTLYLAVTEGALKVAASLRRPSDVLVTTEERAAGGVVVDVSDEGAALASLRRAELGCDRMVLVHELDGTPDNGLLGAGRTTHLRASSLLFLAVKAQLPALSEGKTDVAAVCFGPSAVAEMPAASGLFGGFLKALVREAPRARTLNLVLSSDGVGALCQALDSELAAVGGSAAGGCVEAMYHQGRRYQVALRPLPSIARSEVPLLSADSVVLAAGGGRGITAILCEELTERLQCQVIALGRTRVDELPADIVQMDDEAFEEFEAAYYRRRMGESPRPTPVAMKRGFAQLAAAWEIRRNVDRLGGQGRFRYLVADLLDEAAVQQAVEAVVKQYGRVDHVLFGAGIQVSKYIAKKDLAEFRSVCETKLAGLANLHAACARLLRTQPSFHLLTSAFSAFGNDGQSDYGAANEAMNRLATAMNGAEAEESGQRTSWSSLAWLGWAGEGMTRGSEYRALATHRRLRAITRSEGRALYAQTLRTTLTTPAVVLLSEGEKRFYDVRIAGEAAPRDALGPALAAWSHRAGGGRRRRGEVALEIDPTSSLLLRGHTVNGVPTLPGAMMLTLVARILTAEHPGQRVTAFEECEFSRFVKVREGQRALLRVEWQLVEERSAASRYAVTVKSQFRHPSGVVLLADALHFSTLVELSPVPLDGRLHTEELVPGVSLPDPYLLRKTGITLDASFDCLRNLSVGTARRRADFRWPEVKERGQQEELRPATLLMDALWRFGAIHQTDDGQLAVYVPRKLRRMELHFDCTSPVVADQCPRIVLTGGNPQPMTDTDIDVAPLLASAPDGRVLLSFEGGSCRLYGKVSMPSRATTPPLQRPQAEA